MSWWESILLGLLQGLTEFLPVSSSGHLELGKALFGIEDGGLMFTVLVHGATALSTVVVFRKDILKITVDLFANSPDGAQARRFTGWILLSMIPVAVVGFTARDYLEAHATGNTALVGAALLCTSALLWFAHRKHAQFAARTDQNEHRLLSIRPAVMMGLAQAVAVIPGISRSGATISTGLLLGLSPATAARFSFLMVLPPILGATLLEVKALLAAPAVEASSALISSPAVLALGAAAAFFSGLWACSWMMRGLVRGGLKVFAVYCAAAGALSLIVSYV